MNIFFYAEALLGIVELKKLSNFSLKFDTPIFIISSEIRLNQTVQRIPNCTKLVLLFYFTVHKIKKKYSNQKLYLN